nr:amidohydrolase family protein [uncultured Brevundimonas sp.]
MIDNRCMLLAGAVLLVGSVLSACTGAQDGTYGLSDFARVRKIDAHVHVNVADDAFLDQAAADNFELLSINVDYPAFPSLNDQAQVAHHYAAQNPDRFHYATTFSMKGFSENGWAKNTNAHIDTEVQRGAVAVKVWKNIGMVERNAEGHLIFIDDTGFDPVFNHLTAINIPLIAHQAEPYNCWLPLDQMTTRNDRLYFSAHPEYHMHLHPEMPSHQSLMSRRDAMVARHPELHVVGAHMASLEWNVDEAAKFLDAHPNANLELAARMAQIQHQSVRNPDRVRNFFIKYQDRIMYGTDLTLNPGEDPAAFRKAAHDYWLSDWKYLATNDSQRVEDIDADVPGLSLPKSVIDKIYYGNARKEFFTRKN